MIFLSHKEEGIFVTCDNMDFEGFGLSEGSQRKANTVQPLFYVKPINIQCRAKERGAKGRGKWGDVVQEHRL